MVLPLLSSLHSLIVFSKLTCVIGLMCYYLQIAGEEHRNPVGSSSPKERIESVADTGESDMQEYYEKMLKENPSDPSLLKSYARFLQQVRLFYHVFSFLVFNHNEIIFLGYFSQPSQDFG